MTSDALDTERAAMLHARPLVHLGLFLRTLFYCLEQVTCELFFLASQAGVRRRGGGSELVVNFMQSKPQFSPSPITRPLLRL